MGTNTVLSFADHTDAQWQHMLDETGLFMFAEAAINDAVPGLAEKWGGSLEQTRLYWGETGKIHGSISPYLIPLHRQNWPELSRLIINQPGWGVILQLDWFMQAYTQLQQLQALLAHLREWSWIRTPEDETAILRLSDWLVIKALLMASSPAEVNALLGPVVKVLDVSPAGGGRGVQLERRVEHDLSGRAPQQLSSAQWAALVALSQRVADDDYFAHIRAHHAVVQDWPDEKLLNFIREGEQAAAAYGFTNPQDLIRFLSLMLEMPAGFMDTEWAKKIMAEPVSQLGEYSRMDRLFVRALNELGRG